jgi:hypothetical protein
MASTRAAEVSGELAQTQAGLGDLLAVVVEAAVGLGRPDALEVVDDHGGTRWVASATCRPSGGSDRRCPPRRSRLPIGAQEQAAQGAAGCHLPRPGQVRRVAVPVVRDEGRRCGPAARTEPAPPTRRAGWPSTAAWMALWRANATLIMWPSRSDGHAAPPIQHRHVPDRSSRREWSALWATSDRTDVR